MFGVGVGVKWVTRIWWRGERKKCAPLFSLFFSYLTLVAAGGGGVIIPRNPLRLSSGDMGEAAAGEFMEEQEEKEEEVRGTGAPRGTKARAPL